MGLEGIHNSLPTASEYVRQAGNSESNNVPTKNVKSTETPVVDQKEKKTKGLASSETINNAEVKKSGTSYVSNQVESKTKETSSNKTPEVNLPSYLDTSAKFSYNKEINRVVITIEDNETEKVLKEIPTETSQKILENLSVAKGMVMDQGV